MFYSRFARALMSPPTQDEAARGCRQGAAVELRGRPRSMNILREVASSDKAEEVVGPNRRPASSHRGEGGSSDGGGELMLLLYVLAGREIGQVTVFRRPLSVWRLDLTRL